MPISESMTQELFVLTDVYKCPNIRHRLYQIGFENLSKYMTPERYSKVKNAIKFNDPSKAIMALMIMPDDDSGSVQATGKQVSAIHLISKQWFMPTSIQQMAQDKDLCKLTKRQASTIIDRLKRIEKDTQDADDIDTAANPIDVQTVQMLLQALPKPEPIK